MGIYTAMKPKYRYNWKTQKWDLLYRMDRGIALCWPDCSQLHYAQLLRE